LRSARANQPLAVHLALGQAAGLLSVEEGFWRTTVETLPWLEKEGDEQIGHLRQTLADADIWERSVAILRLQDAVSVDYLAYIEQRLAYHQAEGETEPVTAIWLSDLQPEGWQLARLDGLRPQIRFHLWQMGEWRSEGVWHGTPYSIAKAAQRGYSLTRMEATLTRATGEPLSPERQEQLLAWYRRHNDYRIRPAYVLSVKEPEQLHDVMRNQRWRPHIGQRLSARHAIVSPQIIPLLERHLRREGFSLDAMLPTAPESDEGAASVADSWLALEILAGLGKLIPLPFSLSLETRHRLAEQLTLERRAALEQKAEQVLTSLSAALRGQDAFFPREELIDPELVATIQSALAGEREVEIAYQGLGETAPRWRRVEPHWVEEKRWGLYLHGYCYLAEENRTFRLDRVKAWQMRDRPT
jgi:hypothetical protein